MKEEFAKIMNKNSDESFAVEWEALMGTIVPDKYLRQCIQLQLGLIDFFTYSEPHYLKNYRNYEVFIFPYEIVRIDDIS